MNAFIPYEKNNEHHEDHLTRGFLILLRYSSAVFYMFYDYLREEYLKKLRMIVNQLLKIYFYHIQLMTLLHKLDVSRLKIF